MLDSFISLVRFLGLSDDRDGQRHGSNKVLEMVMMDRATYSFWFYVNSTVKNWRFV